MTSFSSDIAFHDNVARFKSDALLSNKEIVKNSTESININDTVHCFQR